MSLMPIFFIERSMTLTQSRSWPGNAPVVPSRIVTSEPELAVHHAELQADVAAADHKQVLGDRRGTRAPGRGPDVLLVAREAGDVDHLGAGRDHDVVALQRDVAIGAAGDLDRVLVDDLGGAVHDLGAVLLEQARDAAGQLADDALLPLHELVDVELDAVRS